jgi:hypothetical protein
MRTRHYSNGYVRPSVRLKQQRKCLTVSAQTKILLTPSKRIILELWECILERQIRLRNESYYPVDRPPKSYDDIVGQFFDYRYVN